MRVDAALVRRIEVAAAHQARLLADALARRSPTSAAASAAFDGGALVACGIGRYVNRGIGLGLGDEPPATTLDALERFSVAHGVAPMLEVCPWVPAAFVAELASRGYLVRWFRHVFVHGLGLLPPPPVGWAFAEVTDASFAEWAAILGSATEPGSPERAVNDEFCDAAHHVAGQVDLLAAPAEQPGTAALACGSLLVANGVATIGAAATSPAGRGLGAQRALIAARLHRAVAAGADVAVATALVDGSSARNLVALGFQVAYTQAVMSPPA